MFEKYKTFRTHEAGSQYVLENSAVLSFVGCSGIVLSGGFLGGGCLREKPKRKDGQDQKQERKSRLLWFMRSTFERLDVFIFRDETGKG